MKNQPHTQQKQPLKMRLLKWFTPQKQLFRIALSFTGEKKLPNIKSKQPSRLELIYRRIPQALLLLFFIYCIYQNNLRLWLLTFVALGLVVVRREFVFIWWYLKVFLLYRNFYADRRYYYNQGTLYFQFSTTFGKTLKRPYQFQNGEMIIWAMNKKIAQDKFRKMGFTKGEFIKL